MAVRFTSQEPKLLDGRQAYCDYRDVFYVINEIFNHDIRAIAQHAQISAKRFGGNSSWKPS